ncbi:alpha/beta hydrolase [Mucilaginibacter sp. Bleaf8]|uniref:alpha/beta hydrolase fold domain-containing protein n=1 Tax=Mucilaginibacter sp. Bleaf8 TaxID=2834430 RepID=UPI001BCFB22A|nr:alpha/beta hydrolase [Mucilaginibacter sp. Bleaf8]MBS7563413.1 alpha/beta hydrolase [Mucilaginibacter sp. Bleaf8]
MQKKAVDFHHKGQSLRSRLLRLVLRLARLKKQLNNPSFSDRIEKANKPTPPAHLLEGIGVTTQKVEGRNVFTLKPTGVNTKKHVLFFHGGAYVLNFSIYHWKLITQLVKQARCTVIAPDYPLLPDYSYKERISMGEKVYKNALIKANGAEIILMGDSAGGNLALSLAQKFSMEQVPQPSKIILLSPWLDVSMTNPEMKEVDKRDPLLSVTGDSKLGRMHAGDREMTDYLVSPLYGPLQNLAPISLFTGTDDILNPDAHKLKGLADEQNVAINFYEYEHMIHDWILFPMPEARLAFRQVVELINK